MQRLVKEHSKIQRLIKEHSKIQRLIKEHCEIQRLIKEHLHSKVQTIAQTLRAWSGVRKLELRRIQTNRGMEITQSRSESE
jgi:hypothetical protein